jgi:heme exporter protein A
MPEKSTGKGRPLHRVRDSYQQNLLWIGHKPGIKPG